MRWWALGIAALVFGSVSQAGAGPIVLDQLSDGTIDSSHQISGEVWEGQSFTVGVDGNLDRIDLKLGRLTNSPRTGDVPFEVRSVTSGVPSALLAATSIAESSIPVNVYGAAPFVTVDLNSFHIAVNSGDLLMFAMYAVNGSYWLPQNLASNVYPRGSADVVVHGAITDLSFEPPSNRDLMFRTFVELESVPEPGTIVLVAAALAAGLLRHLLLRGRNKGW